MCIIHIRKEVGKHNTAWSFVIGAVSSVVMFYLPLLFTTSSAQVYGLFSTECARYKDLIHLHSFMHDFHLNLVEGMLGGEVEIPDWLDLKTFLEQFTRQNKLPASFIRNRLERG